MIPHSRPWITADDVVAAAHALEGEMIGQGRLCATFERQLAAWIGVEEPGVAVASGTAALVLALLGLEVGPGDEVVVPTYVCSSVLDAIATVNATAIVSDAGPNWVLTAEAAAPHLTPRTRAIVVPHVYGIFADVAGLEALGVPIIEDCAQALGARGERSLAGAVATFSFHPTKCLTTGEGGMVVTGDPALAHRLRRLRDGAHGRCGRLPSPLSDLAAAIGISQLNRYEESLARRRAIAARYRDALSHRAPQALHRQLPGRSMFFRFPITCADGFERVEPSFAEQGVVVRRGVDRLLHRELGLPDRGYPMALELFATTVSLPIYPALRQAQLAIAARAAADILGGGALNRGLRCASA